MTRYYPFLLDPTIYPDYTRRHVQPPTWKTFDDMTQFAVLRVFTQRNGRLVDIQRDLDVYTRQFKLGRVIWPICYHVFAENFADLVAEIKARNLYLYDIWGNVPGASGTGQWPPVLRVDAALSDHLVEELGDHFLGFDNGEHDGRYISVSAPQQCPSPADRFGQYLNFRHHFEQYFTDNGNRITSLVSLCFGHYFIKEGNHYLLGAETAQALPNSQLYYAFIRGAGKQYGVPWFGFASGYNRWGWKSYEGQGGDIDAINMGFRYGPTEGTSLSLLRRLMYSHILYNAVIVGFEQNWLNEDEGSKRVSPNPLCDSLADEVTLSPIGKIQAAGVRWVEEYGQPGVLHTPTAVLLDHFSGWAMPRHLYSNHLYQVWGALPYTAGDFLAHQIFGMLYPGYEDSSFYHDERGFVTPTPYGDGADVLLSDAQPWLLRQYSLIVLGGEISLNAEVSDNLLNFVAEGGTLVLTAANARVLCPGWGIGEPVLQPAGTVVTWADGTHEREAHAFTLCPATLPEDARVLARCGELPAVVEVPHGRGTIRLLLSPFGLQHTPLVEGPLTPAQEQIDQPLPQPFLLLSHARRALDACFQRQQLFSVGEGLHSIVCRRNAREYTVAILNHTLSARPWHLESHIGQIVAVEELPPTDQAVKAAAGYWPTDFQGNDGGISDGQTIAGGDVRLFRIRLANERVELLERAAPPSRPTNRLLAQGAVADLQETILACPTFFQHFDGIKIDWRYLLRRDARQLARERDWLARQQVRLIVDFTSGLNFYPDLTLLDSPQDQRDTHRVRYEESCRLIDDVLEKMPIIGASSAVFRLHRVPEINYDYAIVDDSFRAGVAAFCARAQAHDVTLHLQHHPHAWRRTAAEIVEFIERLNEPNLRFALNTGHAALTGESCADIVRQAADQLGMIIYSAEQTDRFGQSYDVHGPLDSMEPSMLALTELAVPQVIDTPYACWDDVYRSLRSLGW